MKKLLLILSILVASVPTFAKDLPILPDPTITPGEVLETATVDKICMTGYTKKVRNVSQSTKNRLFRLYDIDRYSDKFEIDHLISLELGGSNSIQNLWPQSYTLRPWNAYKKDALENRMHRLICRGELDLSIAQSIEK